MMKIAIISYYISFSPLSRPINEFALSVFSKRYLLFIAFRTIIDYIILAKLGHYQEGRSMQRRPLESAACLVDFAFRHSPLYYVHILYSKRLIPLEDGYENPTECSPGERIRKDIQPYSVLFSSESTGSRIIYKNQSWAHATSIASNCIPFEGKFFISPNSLFAKYCLQPLF